MSSIVGAFYPTKLQNVIAASGIVKDFKGVDTGERHIIAGNWMGPSTQVQKRLARGDKGTTASDEAAKHHDLAYVRIASERRNKLITEPQAATAIRMADNKLQSEIRQGLSKDKSLLNKVHASAGWSGMAIKKIAEDVGALDRGAFVGKGSKKSDPAHKLRKLADRMRKKNRGGSLVARPIKIQIPPKTGGPYIIPEAHTVQLQVMPKVPFVFGKGATKLDVDIDALREYLNSLPMTVLEQMNSIQASGGMRRLAHRAVRRYQRGKK